MDKGACAKGGLVRKRGHYDFLEGFFNETTKRGIPCSKSPSGDVGELQYVVLSWFPMDLQSYLHRDSAVFSNTQKGA